MKIGAGRAVLRAEKRFDTERAARHGRNMGWQLTDSVETYAEAALPFLRERPAEHTVLLTALDNCRAGLHTSATPPIFGWWRDGSGTVRGACSHTPPFQLLFTDLPGEALDDLAGALHDRRRPLPGVMGSPDVAGHFAATWNALTGAPSTVQMEERLYRLAGLVEPDPSPPGTSRRARNGDKDLLIGWLDAFAQESGAMTSDGAAVVDDRIGYGGLVLWELDGIPVAFAGRSRTVADMARIGPVYTPAEQRGQGYGSAVTVAATRAALSAGTEEVVLFTDLANPTSNSIYQRIGFEPLRDRLALTFDT